LEVVARQNEEPGCEAGGQPAVVEDEHPDDDDQDQRHGLAEDGDVVGDERGIDGDGDRSDEPGGRATDPRREPLHEQDEDDAEYEVGERATPTCAPKTR